MKPLKKLFNSRPTVGVMLIIMLLFGIQIGMQAKISGAGKIGGAGKVAVMPQGGGTGLLNVQNNLTGITVGTTDTDIFTYSVSSMAAGTCIEVVGVAEDEVAGVAVQFKLKFGAAVLSGSNTDSSAQRHFRAVVCNDSGSQTAQSMYGIPSVFDVGTYFYGAGGVDSLHVRGTETTSSAVTLKLTAVRASATTTVKPHAWMVRKID